MSNPDIFIGIVGLFLASIVCVSLGIIGLITSMTKKKLEAERDFLSTLDDKTVRKFEEYKREQRIKSLE